MALASETTDSSAAAAKPVADPASASSENLLAELYTGTQEKTLFRSPMVADSYRPPFNSDDLWQQRGSYKIYEDMVFDDQVSVCLQLKKDLVLGEGGMFQPGDENQDEIVDDLETAFFEDYEGDFISELEEILTGYEFGFSLTEKIFKIREGNKLGLKCLRTRHPNSWRLYQDDKGLVEKYEQVTVKGDIDVNPKSLVHYVNNPRFQNPYGQSDLRAAYNAYFAKKEIVKFFAIFMEKAASPIPVGRFDKNAPQAAITKLLDILKRFQTKTAIVIPKDVEVQFLETKNTGEAFIKAIHLFNMFIGRSLFVPDLVGFTGSETAGGSLALGDKQMNIFFMHIFRRRAALEQLINKQFVWPTVMYNFGFVKKYPKFRFKPLDDMKAIELAKVWLEAVKGKTYKPNPEEINYFRKLTKFPEGDVEFVEPAPNPLTGAMPGQNPNDPNAPKNPLDPNAKWDKNAKPDVTQDPAKTNQDPKKNPLSMPAPTKKTFGKVYNLPDGDYYKKVDFKAIENKLNDYDVSVLNDTKPIVKKMLIDLKDQIDRKKILKTGNTERIDSLSLKYKKELKQVLKNSFVQLYKDAQSQAATEILKNSYAKKPLTSEEFLQVIEDESFKFVGDYEYGILKRVRSDLIAAIKDGKPVSEVNNILDNDLNEMSDVQIERFARTKHTEVLNNARVDFFDDSGVVSGYQYSAVLDDRTSDICSGLDGKKFEAGSEPIPPMHFNCRSLLIPITKYEEFKPTEKIRGQDVESFIDENKGDGFSKFTLKEDFPELNAHDVEFEKASPDSLTDVYTYTKAGREFFEVTIVYENVDKLIQKSIKKRKINATDL